MEPTLDDAIARIFGTASAAPAEAPSPDEQVRAPGAAPPAGRPAVDTALAAEARAHYDRAIEAQRSGDWARYGEELRLLGQALQKLQAAGR
jgi:uncharacterized membrane protein (UPF0182 family)